jgi:hypothetical protein
MKPDKLIHQHKMILYNFDVIVEYSFQNDKIRVTAVKFQLCGSHDFIRFISDKALRLIVDDIEAEELKRKWI